MTRITILSFAGLLIGLTTLTTGCKKGKDVVKPKGEVEIVEFCTGDEYESDSKHFRSNGTGESQDREIAKKKARSNASTRLAQTVSATIKAVTAMIEPLMIVVLGGIVGTIVLAMFLPMVRMIEVMM